MTDNAKALADALGDLTKYGCPACGGDCASANPPVSSCPMRAANEALAAYDAAQSAAAIPTLKADPINPHNHEDRQNLADAARAEAATRENGAIVKEELVDKLRESAKENSVFSHLRQELMTQAADAISRLMFMLHEAQNKWEECLNEINRLSEWKSSFDLRWNADQRAIKRWQEAHPGNDLVWPDNADLTVWLLEQLAALSTHQQQGAESELVKRLNDQADAMWFLSPNFAKTCREAAYALSRAPQPDTVTEEMVEAAIAAWHDNAASAGYHDCPACNEKAMRAALTAALAAVESMKQGHQAADALSPIRRNTK